MQSYRPPPSSIPPQERPFGLRMNPLPHHSHNHSPLSPVSFLLRAALIHPTKLAVTHPERGWHITYEQWAARCLSLAFALKSLPGWSKGTRVAIITPNAPLILDAYNGALAVGGVVVPLNIRNNQQEIEYVLSHSDAKVVLVDSELKHLVPKAKPGVRIIVSNDSGGQDAKDAYEAFLQQGRKVWEQEQRKEFQQYGEETARKDWELLDCPDETDVAALCYTSGTTGKPKGVLTTHRGSYLAAVANAVEASIGYDSVYLWVLPAFHACGWTFPWSCIMGFATQHVLRKVDPAQIWHALKEHNVTHYCGAPTVQISLVNHPSSVKLPRQVKVAVAASAPTADLLGKMESLNLMPVHVYGLTETYGPLTRRYAHPSWKDMDLDARARLMARQGHGFVTAEEARVVRLSSSDEGSREPIIQHGRLVDVKRDATEVGEIALRGNIVMQGYFQDDEATNKTIKQGWFLSGDLAVRHPGGEIEIRDRGKDIIISGGENISSLMVEQELASHPAILESCVVARSHPKWGERGHAFIVLKSDQQKRPSTDEIKNFCKERMSKFAVPEWIDFVEELPKTSTGKVQKNVLRGRVSKL
ncbi:unnamed protein product [Sympodiomycopsis kandeliae]